MGSSPSCSIEPHHRGHSSNEGPTRFSWRGPVMGLMGWRGLLRVVDFQELLTAQPVLAAALDKAQRSGGTKSPEAKALREGYQLLAKTLWTRRASIERVHDLAWLDHSAVSAGAPSVAIVFAASSFEDVAAE